MKFQPLYVFIILWHVIPVCISSTIKKQPKVKVYTHHTRSCETSNYRGIIRLSQVRSLSKILNWEKFCCDFCHTIWIQICMFQKSSSCNPDNLDEVMVQDINRAAKTLDATVICGASYRIVEISYKEYCILHFYGSAYNNTVNVNPIYMMILLIAQLLLFNLL